MKGDDCMVLKQRGLIQSVDRSTHVATIKLGDQLVEVRRLQVLRVPIVRVERNAT